MNSSSVDRVSRSLAKASSRRQIIAVIGGAAAGSVARVSGVPRVAAQTAGLSIPVDFTSELGSFVGSFDVARFVFQHGQILVTGTLNGTVTDPLGGVVGTVSQPFTLPMLGSTTGTCEILRLELGPLYLDLLGLRIRLNRIVYEITAQDGGGVLGELFCSIAHLLDGPNVFGRWLAELLNRLLGSE
jgi:hypothetical protein